MDFGQTIERTVWHTEESLFGTLQAKLPQVPMWLELSQSRKQFSSELSLSPICKSEHWEVFRKLRTEIEIPFGIVDPLDIEKIIRGTQQIASNFHAKWFLVSRSDEIVVGSIGLVEFETELGCIGRLLDVDIAPRFQGCGYGNQMMHGIVKIAQMNNLKALCLKADSHRRVKGWYTKLGFQEMGLWQPGKAAEDT